MRAACAAQPYYVAGTGRFCTDVMKLFGARVLVKTGAEGVFCGALPEQGLGIAIKCEDGAARAAEVVMAATIARFLPLRDNEPMELERFVRPALRNWNGIEVGGLRPTAALMLPDRPLRRVRAERHRRPRPARRRLFQYRAACRTVVRRPNPELFSSSRSRTSSKPGSGQASPSMRPRPRIQWPVCASDTRTCQLPPAVTRRASAVIAPNAIR